MANESFFAHIDECLATAIKDVGALAERAQRSRALKEIERILKTDDPHLAAQRADAAVGRAVDSITRLGRTVKFGAARNAVGRLFDIFKKETNHDAH